MGRIEQKGSRSHRCGGRQSPQDLLIKLLEALVFAITAKQTNRISPVSFATLAALIAASHAGKSAETATIMASGTSRAKIFAIRLLLHDEVGHDGAPLRLRFPLRSPVHLRLQDAQERRKKKMSALVAQVLLRLVLDHCERS